MQDNARKLHDFLEKSCSVAEMRHVARRLSIDLEAHLLEGPARPTEFAWDLIGLLARHRAIDAELFRELLALRPKRRAEILSLAAYHGVDVSTPAHPVAKIAGRRLEVALVGVLAVCGIVPGVVILAMSRPDSAESTADAKAPASSESPPHAEPARVAGAPGAAESADAGDAKESVCAENESCRDCECGDGLVCHLSICVDVARVDRMPLICESDKRLVDAVKQLANKCAVHLDQVDGIISSVSCSISDWKHIALEDDNFDLLLSAFPHRFAVHFQSGKRPDWPPSKIESHYLEQIRRFREPLSEAKQIFVIARASSDRSADTELALRHMNFVSKLLETVVEEGRTESEDDRHRVVLRAFTLPRAIHPDRYRGTYLKDLDDTKPLEFESVMTWDEASLAKLRAELDDSALLSAKSGRRWQELYSIINRVVLVIPIPCLGNEYTAASSDLMPFKGGSG